MTEAAAPTLDSSPPELPSEGELQPAVEGYRVELRGYCYRMLGSIFEAEDAVQETMVRAWRSVDKFEGRSSLRSWLYRIATNVCLTAIDTRGRRAMPMDFGPSSTADTIIGPKRDDVPWLEPAPSASVLPSTSDPADAVIMQESIRLAFVAALQHLPARQRAVLILCEVLRWKAEEVAELLDGTVASVNSALQRARATLSAQRSMDAPVVISAQQEVTVNKYIDAFARYDMDALVGLLHQEVIMSMPPYDLWLEGPEQVRAWMQGQGYGCEGSKFIPIFANGAAGYAQYRPSPSGTGYDAWALALLEVGAEGNVVAVTSFLDTEKLFPLFDLPLTQPA